MTEKRSTFFRKHLENVVIQSIKMFGQVEDDKGNVYETTDYLIVFDTEDLKCQDVDWKGLYSLIISHISGLASFYELSLHDIQLDDEMSPFMNHVGLSIEDIDDQIVCQISVKLNYFIRDYAKLYGFDHNKFRRKVLNHLELLSSSLMDDYEIVFDPNVIKNGLIALVVHRKFVFDYNTEISE